MHYFKNAKNKGLVELLTVPKWLHESSKTLLWLTKAKLKDCGLPLGENYYVASYGSTKLGIINKASCSSALCQSCLKASKEKSRKRLLDTIETWQKRKRSEIYFLTLTIPDARLANFSKPNTFKHYRRKVELIKKSFRYLSRDELPEQGWLKGYYHTVEFQFGMHKRTAAKEAKGIRYSQNLNVHYHLALFSTGLKDPLKKMSDLERSHYFYALWERAYKKAKKKIYGTKAYPSLKEPFNDGNMVKGGVTCIGVGKGESAQKLMTSYLTKLDDSKSISYELTQDHKKTGKGNSYNINALLSSKEKDYIKRNCAIIFIDLTYKMKRFAFSKYRGGRKSFDRELIGEPKKFIPNLVGKVSYEAVKEKERRKKPSPIPMDIPDDPSSLNESLEYEQKAMAEKRAKTIKARKNKKKIVPDKRQFVA